VMWVAIIGGLDYRNISRGGGWLRKWWGLAE
jgi:hypothetical protein